MTVHTVLIVDGNPAERERLELTLLRMGLDTLTEPSIADAVIQATRCPPVLCLAELVLPDGDGLALLQQMQQQQPPVPVAFISGSATVNLAVAAMKAGAVDVIPKPLELARLRELLQSVLHFKASKSRKNAVSATSGTHQSSILGNAPVMQQLQTTIRKLARGQVPVYIHGESGSGKERVAHEIHQQGSRAQAPFIPVNCGAIPESLMESEFFGHKKGSFTGAVTDKQGLFQAAHKGTLFLDEVADLPLTMQVKLLRAIQEGAVKPVGGLEEIPVDVRILSATHKGGFRPAVHAAPQGRGAEPAVAVQCRRADENGIDGGCDRICHPLGGRRGIGVADGRDDEQGFPAGRPDARIRQRALYAAQTIEYLHRIKRACIERLGGTGPYLRQRNDQGSVRADSRHGILLRFRFRRPVARRQPDRRRIFVGRARRHLPHDL